jgi:hypothetical protein
MTNRSAGLFNEIIEQSDTCLLSAANFLEASIVIENNRGYDGLRDFDLLMAATAMELAPSMPIRRISPGKPSANMARVATLPP